MPTREAVMSALFAKVQTAASFQTVSRRIDFDPAQGPTMTVATPALQPALYVLEDDEDTHQPSHGGPSKRVWGAMLMIWCKIPDGTTPGVPDGTTSGASVINALIEQVEAVFVPDNLTTGVFTLGGLVQRCWIQGKTVKVPGDFNPSGQCFAAIPVSILVP